MTTLLLARHGETDWNREFRIQGSSDIELNELGRKQAHALAQELEHVELDAIYSSDLSRARATAEAVAASHGLEVRLDPRLRERSFGSWEGLTREDIDERCRRQHHDGETDERGARARPRRGAARSRPRTRASRCSSSPTAAR